MELVDSSAELCDLVAVSLVMEASLVCLHEHLRAHDLLGKRIIF